MVNVVGFVLCLLFLSGSAFAQNTKGDRPVGNQRQVKETRGKSFKRIERGNTKDISGRRLRTKGQSSANRANANYRQPPTAKRSASRQSDRSAPPRGRTFSQSPRETKVRAWKGDVSGHRIRRIRPTGNDAARTNVYPQKGPYVRYARKRPKEKPPTYTRTIKGVPFVKHRPRHQERAWTGGVDKGPIKNQSATGTVRNTYSQRGPYVAAYRKRPKTQAKSFSNRAELAKAKRYSRPPKTGGAQARVYPFSGSRSYVQRGRKNVYWGKYQKKEKGVTTDITGGPLRTRNYRSPSVGIVGRDSLKFFGRKPSGDRSSKVSGGGYATAKSRSGRSWKGDVAGWPVRSPRAPQDRSQKPLKPTEPGIGADLMAKIFNGRFKGVRAKDRRADNRQAARYQGNLPRSGSTKNFGDQGTGYSGNIKSGGRGFAQGGAGYSGNIKGGARRGFSQGGAGYSGNIKGGGRGGFSRAGANYAGNQKRSLGYRGDYIGYSGNMKRSWLSEFSPSSYGYSGFMKRSEQRGFSRDGAGYSGNIKRGKGFRGDYVGYSGNIRRGTTSGFSRAGANYAGNMKRGRGFGTDHIGYSGNIERVGAVKQFNENGVGYSGFMKRGGRGFEAQGGNFQGNVKRSSIAGYNQDGAGFSGRTKYKRPAKGGGSVSGILWNNNESALARNPPETLGGANFSGRTKAKKPAKGGGSVSGILWNNNESALAKNPPENMAGGNFSGRTKAKKPAKGGGSVSGVLWNNNGEALSKSPPENAGAPAGLQVRVKQENYKEKPYARKGSLPGIAPTSATVKASEYSRNMKMYWNYKHNPSSSRDALKTIAPGKAEARIRDYQGNVKMRKHVASGLHPDAKFAHSEEDNVKEERGFLTNVKVFWEKMFHKNGTQPSSVKDKGKKLQYDKREKGLWAY